MIFTIINKTLQVSAYNSVYFYILFFILDAISQDSIFAVGGKCRIVNSSIEFMIRITMNKPQKYVFIYVIQDSISW